MKIAFGMIVFEGDYVLRECLEQVYPYANQILIAEGPVEYWQRQGRTTSTDRTNEILHSFPDPDKKIKIVHGQFKEKDEQCKAYMSNIDRGTDYLWNLDSDEVYSTDSLNRIINALHNFEPTSVGVRSFSFYGGPDHYLSGFELKCDNFLRIFRYAPGATWATHRPPTILWPNGIVRGKGHMTSEELWNLAGGAMHHYSYVFPHQVARKVAYYKECVSKQNCIDNYFNEVYLPWVREPKLRYSIEQKYRGVHEFKPEVRGDCFPLPYMGKHPESINPQAIRFEVLNQLQAYPCLTSV